MSVPLVSVILPVYNGADCVGEAIDSILRQTFGDFELIAINDGSTRDDTAGVLARVAATAGDDRLRVVNLEPNRGLAGALNHGISIARGQYIARQDQDDVSRPPRLAAQVRFLEHNPRCGLVGTRAEIWIGDAPSGRHFDHPTDNAMLQFDLLTNNPFVHSSVMIRRSALDEVGVYSTSRERQPPEDFELWSRIARRFTVANLPERLVIYRETPGSMSRAVANPFQEKLVLIAAENLAHAGAGGVPMSVCVDTAALVHGAYWRVSPQCDIRLVCRLVEAATRHIEADNAGADLGARRRRLIRDLRHHDWARRGKLPPLARLRRLLRRIPVIGPVGKRVVGMLRQAPRS
jgi:glycosyltransferase involved in cell wall biosynthesis